MNNKRNIFIVLGAFLSLAFCIIGFRANASALILSEGQNVDSYIKSIKVTGHCYHCAYIDGAYRSTFNVSFKWNGGSNYDITQTFHCINPGYAWPDMETYDASEFTAKVTSISNFKANISITIYTDSGEQNINGKIRVPVDRIATFTGTTSRADGQSGLITLTNTDTTTLNFAHQQKRKSGSPKADAKSITELYFTDKGQNGSYSRVDNNGNPSSSWTTNCIKNQEGACNKFTTKATVTLGIGERKEYCEKLYYDSKVVYNESNNHVKVNAHEYSAPACVTVERPRNFDVTNIKIDLNDEIVYPGETASTKVTVDTDKLHDDWTTAATMPRDAVKVSVVQFLLDENIDINAMKAIDFNAPNPDAPAPYSSGSAKSTLCSYVSNKLSSLRSSSTINSTCEIVEDGAPLNITTSGVGRYFVNTYPAVPDREVGKKYCVAGIINYSKYDGVDADIASGQNWALSDIECRTIAKKPSIQIENSSIYSAGNISASLSKKQNMGRTYGSWGEYIISSMKEIKGFASGGILAGGINSTEPSICSLSPLTIANKNCKNNSSGNSSVGSSGITPTAFATRLYNYYTSDAHKNQAQTIGSTTISSMDDLENKLNSDKTILIVNGDVTINGNILENASYRASSPIDTLQHIIIATGNIIIPDNLANDITIDAWLIAPNGELRTCGNLKIGDNNYNSEVCNKTLTVNGIVATKNIASNRTAGAGMGNDSATPAERIIINPAAYLWGYGQAISSSSQADTVYLHELAPRY